MEARGERREARSERGGGIERREVEGWEGQVVREKRARGGRLRAECRGGRAPWTNDAKDLSSRAPMGPWTDRPCADGADGAVGR